MGLAVLLTGSAVAETVEFQDGVLPTTAYAGTRDTIIKNGTPTLNFGALPRLRVTTQDIGTNAQTWTLVRWDISAWVPPGAVVTQVQVVLDVEASETGATTSIYQLLRNWTEGDGTTGSGASWNTYNGVNNWGTAGAENTTTDRGNTVLGSVPGTPAGPQVVTLNATGLAVVQGWADDPAQNFGFVIRSTSTDAVDYGSRETPTATRRPRLVVTFTPPSGAVTTTTVTFQDGVAPTAGYAGTTDTYMDSDTATTNLGGSATLQCDGNDTTRALLRWDTTAIPAGSVVTAASVSLRVFDNGSSYDLFDLRRAWVEGQATWNQAATGTNWGTAGAASTTTDYVNTVLGTVPAPVDNSTETAALNAAGLVVVQRWIDTPASNRGLLLRGANTTLAQYRSSEFATTLTHRPALSVTYQTPVTGVDKTIAGGASWQTAAAWTPAGLPGANDRVTILGPGTVSFNGTATVNRVVTTNGGSLALSGGTLTVSDLTWVSLGSDLTVNAGATFVGQGPTRVLHSGRLFVNGGAVRLGAPSCWVGGALESAGGSLLADVPASRADVQARGTLSLNGLTVRDLDAQGLHVYPTGTISRLRAVRFESHPGGTGAFLTVEHPGPLAVSAPGCWFDAISSGVNVRLVDTHPATVEDVVLNFEDRGTATNGDGVGEGLDADDDPGTGSSVNWVHAAPDTTSGTATGAPQLAWDLTTFAGYAVYAAFRDAGPANQDRIHVFDTAGDGVDQGYWFEVDQGLGDIVGYPWWDQVAGLRVLWVATTTGHLLRFTDPGSGSGAVLPTHDVTAPGGPIVFTTPPLTADSTTVFVGGTAAGTPRVFAFAADPPAHAWTLATPLTDPITSELGSETLNGITRLFMGGGAALPGGGVTLLALQTFDADPAAPQFDYVDDLFRGTSNPAGATGAWGGTFGRPPPPGGNNGGMRVTLGPNSTNMSGGFRATFTVPGTSPLPVRVDFAYRHVQSSENEFDEYSETLVAIDGVLAGSGGNDWVNRFVGDGNGGPNSDTGWQSFSFVRVLAPGAHVLTLGGFYNKSTFDDETAQVSFDNVQVQTSPTQGRIYSVDTANMAVDDQNTDPFAPVVAAPFPAYRTGLFVGDTAGRVHGLEHTLTMDALSGWPKQGGSSAVQGSVWLDFAYQQVFWGDEGGVTHGYTVAGAGLSGFPLANALGDGLPLRQVVSDAGVLWLAGQGGRVQALDISTGATIGTRHRFGRSAPASKVTFNEVGWSLQSGGKVLFLDYLADPSYVPPPP